MLLTLERRNTNKAHQSPGQASSHDPMGLSSRISCAYGCRLGGSCLSTQLPPEELLVLFVYMLLLLLLLLLLNVA
jgi:hypothetical protein